MTNDEMRFGRGSGAFYGRTFSDVQSEWAPKVVEWFGKRPDHIKDWSPASYVALGKALTVKTGNEFLDETILNYVQKLDTIPQYFHVMNSLDISRFDLERFKQKCTRDDIKKRMIAGDHLVGRISGGIPMGSTLAPSAPESPFYDQIKDYCRLIGGNNYK